MNCGCSSRSMEWSVECGERARTQMTSYCRFACSRATSAFPLNVALCRYAAMQTCSLTQFHKEIICYLYQLRPNQPPDPSKHLPLGKFCFLHKRAAQRAKLGCIQCHHQRLGHSCKHLAMFNNLIADQTISAASGAGWDLVKMEIVFTLGSVCLWKNYCIPLMLYSAQLCGKHCGIFDHPFPECCTATAG